MQFIVVDLPLPFGPSNPNISPSCTSKDRLSIAFYCFTKFFTSIILSIIFSLQLTIICYNYIIKER